MSETFMELASFIESEHYSNLIDMLRKNANIELNNEVPDVLLGHDARRIAAAELEVEDLNRLLLDVKKAKLIQEFVSRIMQSVTGNEEDFPAGAEQDASDRPVLKKVLPYYRSFLITFLVQFYLIENHPERLDAYYKATRTPAAKKHKNDMMKIYRGLEG